MAVTVRHNARLGGLLALAAGVLTVAWFSRALQTGSVTDSAWCALVASVAVLQLLVVRDARAPLMVADEQGIRFRRGETWSGLRWQDIARVEVRSPGTGLRDGAIVVHPRVVDDQDLLDGSAIGPVVEEAGHDSREDLGAGAAPGEAYTVRLGRTTRVDVDAMTGDLVADLDTLASGQAPVLVPSRLEPVLPTDGEAVAVAGDSGGADDRSEKPSRLRVERARWAGRLARATAVPLETEEAVTGAGSAARADSEAALEETVGPEVGPEVGPKVGPEVGPGTEPEFEPVSPVRETRPAARSEILRETVRRLPDPPTIPAQRHQGSPVVARVDDFAPAEPSSVQDALIGPLVAAARNRARLSIDTLSERTRIRPHVLERIEVDDFAACGGDFYARGHLRTLGRIFGLDAEHLIALYDEHYAQAEIQARQVFEAELASGIGGGVRAAHSGPRWTLLAACVLALAGVWGVARVFNDTPQELVSPAPHVVDSAGLASDAEPAAAPRMTLAPLEVTAVGASPQVVVRDRDGRILWAAKLSEGQRQQVIGLAPFEVTASNGAAVKVAFLGKAKGTVGADRAAASRQFG